MCVGEQPLHAVPLLQFHNKRIGAASNDFSMPHWINLSFYSSSKRIGYSTFLPRIKMAPIINKPPNKSKRPSCHLMMKHDWKWINSIKSKSKFLIERFDRYRGYVIVEDSEFYQRWKYFTQFSLWLWCLRRQSIRYTILSQQQSIASIHLHLSVY